MPPKSKRSRPSPTPSPDTSPAKKARGSSESPHPVAFIYEKPGVVATSQAAARVDADPPLNQLLAKVEENRVLKLDKGEAAVYWMRMEDMRGNFPA